MQVGRATGTMQQKKGQDTEAERDGARDGATRTRVYASPTPIPPLTSTNHHYPPRPTFRGAPVLSRPVQQAVTLASTSWTSHPQHSREHQLLQCRRFAWPGGGNGGGGCSGEISQEEDGRGKETARQRDARQCRPMARKVRRGGIITDLHGSDHDGVVCEDRRGVVFLGAEWRASSTVRLDLCVRK
jgi:hypothetical protein